MLLENRNRRIERCIVRRSWVKDRAASPSLWFRLSVAVASESLSLFPLVERSLPSSPPPHDMLVFCRTSLCYSLSLDDSPAPPQDPRPASTHTKRHEDLRCDPRARRLHHRRVRCRRPVLQPHRPTRASGRQDVQRWRQPSVEAVPRVQQRGNRRHVRRSCV